MSKASTEEEERISLLSSASTQKSYKTSEACSECSSVRPKLEPSENDSITYSWNNICVWTSAEVNDHRLGGQRSTGLAVKGTRSGVSCLWKKYASPVSKQVLTNVNGVARPGELLAILGTSGSGKTSLLNALTYRNIKNVRVSGFRRVNGIPVDLDMLKVVSSYVQQDDLFMGTLTVQEHLTFQALLRTDPNISKSKRYQRVNEVIKEFGLTRCAQTLIGDERQKGISNGEKKLLAFASEVLTDPLLIFCDEPTSGLDSVTAQNIVYALRKMAEIGKTVICTIHQPSSELYAMFDRILLMAEGRTAFLGTPKKSIEFFNNQGFECPFNFNPADYFIEILAIQPGNEQACLNIVVQICNAFEQSERGQQIQNISSLETTKSARGLRAKMTLASRSRYKVSWTGQLSATLWRSRLTMLREPMILRTRLLQTVIMAFLLSVIYWGQKTNQDGVMNINGALFLFLTYMTFENVFGVIDVRVFSREVQIFFREHSNGMYRTDVYFISKTLAELPLFTIFPVIFTSICYFTIGLNPETLRLLITCVIVILVAHVACSLGYLVSCISPNVTFALALAAPIIIPLMIFGGFFLNKASVPVYFAWVPYLSWFKYGNEALLINQWENIDTIQCTRSNSTCPANGTVVLEMLNFNKMDLTFDLEMLLVLAVGYRLLAYFALLLRTYGN